MLRAEHSLPGGVSAGSSVSPSIALQSHFFFSLGLTFHSRQDKPKRAQRRKAQILSRPTEWVLGGKTTKLGWVLLRAQKQSQEDGVRRAGIHFLLHLQQQRHFVLNVIKLWMGLSFLRSLLPEVTRSLPYNEVRCREEGPTPQARWGHHSALSTPLTTPPPPALPLPRHLKGTFLATRSSWSGIHSFFHQQERKPHQQIPWMSSCESITPLWQFF